MLSISKLCQFSSIFQRYISVWGSSCTWKKYAHSISSHMTHLTQYHTNNVLIYIPKHILKCLSSAWIYKFIAADSWSQICESKPCVSLYVKSLNKVLYTNLLLPRCTCVTVSGYSLLKGLVILHRNCVALPNCTIMGCYCIEFKNSF